MSLRRRRPLLVLRSRILVVCEGRVTEPCYLRAFIREYRSHLVRIEIEPAGATPGALIDVALQKLKEAATVARRERDPLLRFDECWCVFDVDQHADIEVAKQRARQYGIQLAISNPCIELWLLLHFADRNAYLTRVEARRLCKHHMPDYDKEPPMDVLLPSYEQAVLRALALEEMHMRAQRTDGNPMTRFHVLTEKIRHNSVLQQLRKGSQ